MARRGFSLRLGPSALLRRTGILPLVQQGLFEAGSILENEWKLVLSKRGTGKIYMVQLRTMTRGGRTFVASIGESRPPHQASRPGQPPAVDSGLGRASIATVALPGLSVRVGTDKPYLRYLQYGVFNHPGGIVIKPRPHADRALTKAKPKMQAAFRRTVNFGMK